jgi:hypothetical protein
LLPLFIRSKEPGDARYHQAETNKMAWMGRIECHWKKANHGTLWSSEFIPAGRSSTSGDFSITQVHFCLKSVSFEILFGLLQWKTFPNNRKKWIALKFIFMLNMIRIFFWDRVLLCIPGWPQTHESPASAYRVPGL